MSDRAIQAGIMRSNYLNMLYKMRVRPGTTIGRQKCEIHINDVETERLSTTVNNFYHN